MKMSKTILFSLTLCAALLASCDKKQDSGKELVQQALLQDSLNLYKKLYAEAAYFSIDKNENAHKEFRPTIIEDVMAQVIQDFTVLNKQEGGNPLLPQNLGGISKVNRLTVINHKWLIVDFYSDSFAGEVLIRYHYNPEQVTEFEVIDTVVY